MQAFEHNIGPIPVRYYWFSPILLLLGFFLFVGLGVWQLHRASSKNELIQAQQAAELQAPKAFDPGKEEEEFTRITVKGRYAPAKTVLLQNQFREHQLGYDVFTLFSVTPTPSEKTIGIWVNRGFLKASSNGSALSPDEQQAIASLPETEITLVGLLKKMPQPFVLKKIPLSDDFPQKVDQINTADFERLWDLSFYPKSLTLFDNNPGVLTADHSPRIMLTPERHQGYAVQWFIIAALYPFLFVAAHRQKTGRTSP